MSKDIPTVSLIEHEEALFRAERANKRLCLLCGSVALFNAVVWWLCRK